MKMKSDRNTSKLDGGNLFVGLPDKPLQEEKFDVLFSRPDIKIERIISTGQRSADDEWYDQTDDEWVVLLSGAARLRIEGEAQDRQLAPGDWLLLPAHCRHRVTWTQENPATVWLAVHIGQAS